MVIKHFCDSGQKWYGLPETFSYYIRKGGGTRRMRYDGPGDSVR
jgi:hypothetical protein